MRHSIAMTISLKFLIVDAVKKLLGLASSEVDVELTMKMLETLVRQAKQVRKRSVV